LEDRGRVAFNEPQVQVFVKHEIKPEKFENIGLLKYKGLLFLRFLSYLESYIFIIIFVKIN